MWQYFKLCIVNAVYEIVSHDTFINIYVIFVKDNKQIYGIKLSYLANNEKYSP